MFAQSAVSRRLAWIKGKVASSPGANAPFQWDAEAGSFMYPRRITNSRKNNLERWQDTIDGNANKPSQCPRLHYSSGSSKASSLQDNIPLDILSGKRNSKGRPRSRSLDSMSFENDANDIQRENKTHKRKVQKKIHENDDTFQNEDQVVIQQPNAAEGGPESSHDVGRLYRLKSYLEQMYFVGVSPYRTKQQCVYRTNEIHGWIWLALHSLQKILFVIITVMSAWRSISDAKYCYLLFMSGVGLHNFVDFGFNFVSFATKGQHVYTMIFKRKKVDKMLKTMDHYEMKYITNGQSNNKRSILSTALGIGTTVAVALRVCLTSGVFGWSFKGFVLGNSVEFTQDVFVWDHQNMSFQIDELHTKYSSNLTTVSVTFGISTLVADLSSGMQMESLRDLLLLVALTVHCLVRYFMNKIEGTMINVSPSDIEAWNELQRNREACWSMYRHVKDVVADANDVHDDMLKIMHVDNLLLYAHFVSMCITRSDATLGSIIYHLWTLSKSEMTYYIAASISGYNDPLRKWIRNWGCHTGKIKVGDDELDVNVVLDELTNEPLGFGKGNFLIKPTFHFKFLGLVGSFALFLADEKRKDE